MNMALDHIYTNNPNKYWTSCHFQVIATVISLMLVDKVGRRKLLVTGAAVMALATLTLGILADMDPDTAMLNPCRDLNTSASDNTTSLHLTQPYNLTQPLTGGSSWPLPNPAYLHLDTAGSTPHSALGLSLWTEPTNSSSANSSSPNLHPDPTPSQMPLAARYASLAALMLFCGAYGLSFGPGEFLLLPLYYLHWNPAVYNLYPTCISCNMNHSMYNAMNYWIFIYSVFNIVSTNGMKSSLFECVAVGLCMWRGYCRVKVENHECFSCEWWKEPIGRDLSCSVFWFVFIFWQYLELVYLNKLNGHVYSCKPSQSCVNSVTSHMASCIIVLPCCLT